MKLSIITVSFNSESTIEDTIHSVLSQTCNDIEYILVDGNSRDTTMEIVDKYRNRIDHVVSEPDLGIWDAMNKGVALASGDFVGFLNSDDVFASKDTLKLIEQALSSGRFDAVFGFVDIVRAEHIAEVVRRYRVKQYNRCLLRMGLMPAHPGFFCKKQFFDEFGGFSLDPSVAPDFELMVRFLVRGNIKARLIPSVLVKMRDGGLSNTDLSYIFGRFLRQVRSCRINGLWTHSFVVLSKYPYKFLEFFRRD